MTERLSMRLHAVSVRRGDKWVLRSISWSLQPGERWALLGDNGAGKTQLLKLLSGDVWPTPGGPERRRNAGGRSSSARGAPPIGRTARSQAAGRLCGRRTAGQIRALRLEPARP